jgi:signal transduction histidine kinase
MTRFIDLSHPITRHMPCYPGDPGIALKQARNIREHGCDVLEISMGSHTGAHIDAPSHMIEGGKTLGDFDLSSFCGTAVKVGPDQDMEGFFDAFDLNGIILETGWGAHFSRPDIYYGPGRPAIPDSFVKAIGRSKIKFFGCDLPSVDPSGARDKTVHRALLSRDILIYENLANMEKLPEKTPFLFYGFPLNIPAADGCPVRAAAQIGKSHQALAAKYRFLAEISHDLRVPLNGMVAIADSLAGAGGLSEDQAGLVSMMGDCARRLTLMADNILEYSIDKRRAIRPDFKPVNVRKVAEWAMTFSKPLVREKPIFFVNDIPEDLPMVRADENKLGRILQNLIANAGKFTQKGKITVGARVEKNGEIRVSVTDTGPGIPKDRQTLIFKPFERAGAPRDPRDAGVGLGLAVSRKLAREHGGEIRLERSGPGGSVFSLIIPGAGDPDQKTGD